VLFDLAPIPAYIFDDATCEFLAVNKAALQFYGYSRDEFLKLSLDDIRPPEDRSTFHEVLQVRLHESKFEVGWRHKTKAGEIVDVQIVSQPITYNGRAAHFVVATDVTEQRRLQEALFHSRRRLQALFDYALDAIFLVNDAGEYVDVNPAACAFLGYTRAQILRMRVGDMHPNETAAQGRDMWRALLSAGTLSGEYRLHASDGTPRDVEFRAVANVLPGLHLSVMRDVTERNHARGETETRLRESHEQLRRLSARSRARREEDRTRLSRELHDQLGQALAGIKIDLHWIGQHAGPDREPGSVGAKADATMRLVDDTIWRVRRLSSQLRPPVLDKLGLIAAIEWEAKEFERRAGIRTRVQSNAEHVALDPGRATAVFRMLQEALTNVATHARATRITVAVREANGALAVSVSDNGRGIPCEQVVSLESLGLLGMCERAVLLGGSVEVRGNRPRGTVVVMSIPLAERRLSPRDELT
jgi:PAS domain S-box-containing protein